jgi:N-carbamoyl-L-amino-acid hydrolase
LTVDLRHPEDRILDSMESALQNAVQNLIRSSTTGVTLNRILNCPPVVLDMSCVAAVRTGVEKERFAAREIVSGPGHDAVYVSKVVPTSMIFVPCAGGLSHNEAESITQADATAGAQVLLDAVLALDARAAM